MTWKGQESMLVFWRWSINVAVAVGDDVDGDVDVGDMLTDFWFMRQPLTTQTQFVLVDGWKWWPKRGTIFMWELPIKMVMFSWILYWFKSTNSQSHYYYT